MKKLILKSLLAGVLIGLGAYAYVACLNKGSAYIGSFLFSIGLISVFILEASLFTGKIGSIELNKNSIVSLLLMLVFNFVGIIIVAGLSHSNANIVSKCNELVLSKLDKSLVQVIVDSTLCGVMIELSVLLYKKNKSLLVIVLPIMVFILSGFEHCIANMFYYISGFESFSTLSILYFLLYILGNSIGAILLHKLYEASKIEKNKNKEVL